MGYDVVAVTFSSVCVTANVLRGTVFMGCATQGYTVQLYLHLCTQRRNACRYTRRIGQQRSYTVMEEDFLYIVKQVHKANTGCYGQLSTIGASKERTDGLYGTCVCV